MELQIGILLSLQIGPGGIYLNIPKIWVDLEKLRNRNE